MNFEHFLTKRILNAKPYKNSVSAPIIKIGVTAIVISMIVMIVSVGVGLGMQKEIKDKISSIEGHISVQSFNNSISENSVNPISPDENFINNIINISEVRNVEKIISRFGIVRTTKDFEGAFFKGIESDYDFSQINNFLIKGAIPSFSDTFSNDVLISQLLANKIDLKIGDSFQMLFSRDDNYQPAIIRLVVSGIYDSGFEELDSKFLFGDINQIRRISKWEDNQIGSIEIHLIDQKYSEKISDFIYLNSPSDYDVVILKEKYFSIFEWIELFDKNIFAIIFIMILVASINIISVLVVLILERTNMIGILKALGATNISIRKFFIYTSMYLISIGIIIGNFFGLLILFLQKNYKIISLDSKIYYVDSVPVFIEFYHILILNIIVFVLCVFSILLPSLLVTKINPKDIIKFN
ncbi:MAG: ABC transporter permease [Flavobacteriaceae bacterium]